MREDYIRYVERRRRIYAATVLLLFGLIVYAWIRPRPVGPEPTTDEDEDPTPTKSQLDRRAKSNTIIKKMGLPCNEDLPVIENEKDIAPRGKEELTRRCMAVEICAVKGKTRDQAMIEKAIEQWGAADFFSPNERAFVLKMSPTEQECVDFAWRFECVHVLLWALGYVEDLNPPNLICDVQKEITIFSSRTWDQFIADARPRRMKDLLDQADLYYRLHWGAIELRLRKQKCEAANEEVIMERLRALNWLIRYMNQEWDDVTTDT